MAYKPNYGLQRADRNRAARARSEQKQRVTRFVRVIMAMFSKRQHSR